MTVRTPAEIRGALECHIELWNARDREGWLSHWKSTCPGGYTLEDPVGTPAKRDLLAEVWDAAFAETAWVITMKQCIVCANEAALVMINQGMVAGAAIEVAGVELYRFNDDGSVHQRTFYEPPAGSTYVEWTTKTGDTTPPPSVASALAILEGPVDEDVAPSVEVR
jgi:hypothetical protein